jgi:hypothetical protein
MTRSMRRPLAAVVGAGALAVAAFAATGSASPTDPSNLTNVPAANTKSPGISSPNILSPELTELAVARGSHKLENPTAQVPYYGYDGNGTMLPVAPSWAEAKKTEPDKNTYLTLSGIKGADPAYDYGTHFLYQGHEGGAPAGYITRVNLDADAAHRVTLLATKDTSGADLPTIDGSTWDPWAKRLLFTAEGSQGGGVWQSTPDIPAKVESLTGILGQGGFEGIQNDSDGNIWIVEDSGGTGGATNTHAKQPNSFVYRFKPTDPADLTKGGVLQALQVTSLRTDQPIQFHAGQADADIKSDDTKDLHTYGHTFQTRWVTIHDTADGTAPFSATDAAKAHHATPFKRPENGQFQPGSHFGTFLFDETGDTDNRTEAGADYGGYGGVQVLTQSSPSADTGTLHLLYQGDQAHTGFDNVTFLARDKVAFVEDAGDTLHTQRNALDSGYVLDTQTDYSAPGTQPVRFLAEGRDASATIDSALGSSGNDGDNEITGIHASDGDPTTAGILGAKVPRLFSPADGNAAHRWRLFYTAQHGDNVTWEIVPAER